MFSVQFFNIFVLVFTVGTLLEFAIHHYLEFIAFRTRRNQHGLPTELTCVPAATCFDAAKLAKIRAYKNAGYFAWLPAVCCTTLLSLALAFSGFYPFVFHAVCRITGSPHGFGSTYLCALLFFAAVAVPKELISVPFALYREFGVEKRFGFSNMTFKLWLSDAMKQTALSAGFGAALLAAVIAILTAFPKAWWIFVTAALFAFSLLLMVIYPLIIAPLFNRFTPLADGELKDKIARLMEKLNFKMRGIFIMDASKRSGHSNAYFGGIGKSKRIVLFDTLTQILTADELVAVLGHELGHYKLHHIIRRFLLTAPLELLLMLAFYLCAQSEALYAGFGFAIEGNATPDIQFIGLFLISLAASPLASLCAPITHFFSRKDEFAADAFSADLTGNPDALISGLIKLSSENLSELLPPSLYAFWHYSHPTLLERIRALRKMKK